MHNLLDPDLLGMLASELGVGVLIMAWLEIRKQRRDAVKYRHQLREKWRIYVMATAALDDKMKELITESARKELH